MTQPERLPAESLFPPPEPTAVPIVSAQPGEKVAPTGMAAPAPLTADVIEASQVTSAPPGDENSLMAAKPAGREDKSAPSRRGFFVKLMRDAVGPLAAILEHRVAPVTDALQGRSAFMEDTEDDIPSEPPDSYSTAPHPRAILRPPGALPPGDFEFACSRCGKCGEACPVQAIQIDPAGVVAGGFPYIVPEISPCVVCAELSCMKSCPTGALVLVDKAAIRIGLAEVDHLQCVRSTGEDCRLCLEACPVENNALIISAGSGKVLVKLDRCVGCGMCEKACPTQPSAIVVNPRPHLDEPIIA